MTREVIYRCRKRSGNNRTCNRPIARLVLDENDRIIEAHDYREGEGHFADPDEDVVLVRCPRHGWVALRGE